MSETTVRVAVAISVYNGEEHLREQIDSILNQTIAPQVSLYVRDDGSHDGSVALLAEYERKGLLTLIRGENVGVVRSFLSLIESIGTSFDYIALCDQDDVWRADKLERALAQLARQDASIPQLYCSEYVFCDADMHEQGPSHLNCIGVDFTKMLYENRTSGNTMVMNRALTAAVIRAGADGVYCHDWWIALVATALGNLTYDDFASLYYRRTGSNVSPTGSSALHLLRYRIRTFFEKKQLSCVTKQLEKLYAVFGDEMSSAKRAELSLFLHAGRFRKACYPKRLRQKVSEELTLRAFFLVGLL